MIDKLVFDLEELGLKIDEVIEVRRDVMIKTKCGVKIWVFDSTLELEPRIEHNGLVYFTDGNKDLAISIVNQVEAIKLS